MSKITDAMKKAEGNRDVYYGPQAGKHFATTNGQVPGSGSVGRPVYTVMPAAPAAAPVQEAVPARRAEGTATSAAPASPEAWDKAIEVVKRQLEGYEQQAVRQAGELARLQAQLDASEQLSAKLEQERTALRQRLEQEAEAGAHIERARSSWIRQMEALRECQQLSHACRMAEQELEASTVMLTRIAQSRQQVDTEMAHYQRRAEALRQQVGELRFRLGNALACTGTTDQPHGNTTRSA